MTRMLCLGRRSRLGEERAGLAVRSAFRAPLITPWNETPAPQRIGRTVGVYGRPLKICGVLLGRDSSTYFMYACGALGRKPPQLHNPEPPRSQ